MPPFHKVEGIYNQVVQYNFQRLYMLVYNEALRHIIGQHNVFLTRHTIYQPEYLPDDNVQVEGFAQQGAVFVLVFYPVEDIGGEQFQLAGSGNHFCQYLIAHHI
ncbi:MAG TPA: hypothetical protein VGD89_01225 [Flavipsychrobacter sp.]